jgi:hypothetical protein
MLRSAHGVRITKSPGEPGWPTSSKNGGHNLHLPINISTHLSSISIRIHPRNISNKRTTIPSLIGDFQKHVTPAAATHRILVSARLPINTEATLLLATAGHLAPPLLLYRLGAHWMNFACTTAIIQTPTVHLHTLFLTQETHGQGHRCQRQGLIPVQVRFWGMVGTRTRNTQEKKR